MEKLKPMLWSVMKGYTKEQLVKDIVAGIIVAIIALPLSIALALASGVTPERGIYTAITAGFVISFLGGSRVQIAGPTAAFATIVAGIAAENGTGNGDGRYYPDHYGCLSNGKPDQIYSIYDHDRFYSRYCRYDFYWAD